jgi:hypothetical protein
MMNRSLPVWQTLSDAFEFVYHRFGLFVQALILPLICLALVQGLSLFFPLRLQPFAGLLVYLANLMIFAWMMNVCCRLAITQVAGPGRWTSAETWTALWLFALTFVLTLLAAIPAFGAYLFISAFNSILGLPAAVLTFLILHLYLFSRFVLVFPATAMGDKASFREAWELSEGNGWRLVLLFALVPFLYGLVALILFTLLPVPLFMVLLLTLWLLFALVGVVAVAMAYKQLKNR